MFTYEECFEESLSYFDGDELAAKVFLDKYALRDVEGNLLEKTPEDMHRRIAKEFARIEAKKFKNPLTFDKIFALLDRFRRIIPQGSLLYGIGNIHQYVTLSNCYVVESPLDSYAGIHKVDEEISQISKRRGGVGLDISNIRPNNTITRNAARTSTGIIPFMERFSNSIREVGQGGRRGALMLTISIHHPQVLDFVKVKRDLTKVTGANISVRLTDEFLEAVDKGIDYEQRFPVDAEEPQMSRMVSAKEVWDAIVENAWSMAEPGILFWDTITRESPADCYKPSAATNPCCFAANEDVFVLTREGTKEIKQITSEDEVFVEEGVWGKTSGYFSAGTASVYKVEFSDKKTVLSLLKITSWKDFRIKK